MKKRNRTVALGTLIAAGLGYVTGLLTAPKSGKETRKDIEQAALKAKAEAEKKLKDIHSELTDLIEKARSESAKLKSTASNELHGAIEKAQEARDKTKGLLSALHEGDSVDSDLQKAVKEAKAATEHLKKYIEKNDSQNKAKS
jgi:gas vesicle protein